MTILEFKGIVDTSDSSTESAYTIGGVDFIAQIRSANFAKPVTVALADERFTGDLSCSEGSWGYSEYTPGWAAELDIGPHNILKILDRYDGDEITLWIADEPINTLDQEPSHGR